MRPVRESLEDSPERRLEVGARVADQLAEAPAGGPRAALLKARGLTDRELRLGLEFIATVLDVAASSARALSTVLVERGDESGSWH